MVHGPEGRSTRRWRGAVVAAFVAVGLAAGWGARGDDLASSYMAAAVLSAGHADHVYAHDAQWFDAVHDPVWDAIAADRGVAGFLHPYVQLPLWAAALRPLTALPFAWFNRVFMVLHLLCMAGVVLLAADLWNRALLAPRALAALLALLAVTEPARYALALNQTTPLVLLGTIGAVWLERRGRLRTAGLMLACVTALKLTPGIVALWWLLERRKQPLWAFAAGLAGLAVASVVVGGVDLNLAYLQNVRRLSDLTVVAFNNQSLQALLVRGTVALPESFMWRVHATPEWVRPTVAAAGLLLALAVVHRARAAGAAGERIAVPGLLLVATILAPIAWTHYFLVLVIPAVVLHADTRATGYAWVVLGAVWLANCQPMAMATRGFGPSGNMWVWSHLLSAGLCLAALLRPADRAKLTA